MLSNIQFNILLRSIITKNNNLVRFQPSVSPPSRGAMFTKIAIYLCNKKYSGKNNIHFPFASQIDSHEEIICQYKVIDYR